MDIINIISEILSAPTKWVSDRIIDAKKYNGGYKDGWLLNTEFGIPFCYFFVVQEDLIASEQIIQTLSNVNNNIELSILINKDGSFFVYRWSYQKNSLQKFIGKVDLFKSYDKKSWFKKVLAREENGHDLNTITSKIENTIFQIHSFIRDIDALHSDVALDEICKLLYVKLYDEETTKKGDFYRFQRNRYATADECSSIIRSLYVEANEHDNRVFSLRIPGYKRSRGVFDTPILLSSEAISRIVEHLQGFSFLKSDVDLIGRIFQNLINPVLRGGFGQYFTPLEVVEFIVNIIKPQINDLVIDPFAGSGHFLTSTIRYVRNTNPDASHKQMDEFLFTHLHGMEISERMVRISMTDMRLHGDGHSNIRCVDALLDFENYQDLQPNSFDIVMTNPPFGSIIETNNATKLGQFSLAVIKRNTPLDVLGLERSFQLLRTNGKIAIILPESIFVNSNLKYVRDWIISNINVIGLFSLPIETFSPYGANIKTSILIGKKSSSNEINNNNKVFIGQISNVGYDASGRKILDSDMDLIKNEFDAFIKINNIIW